jgi:hypothetical protein
MIYRGLASNPDWYADCKRWRGEPLIGHYSHWCFEWDGLPVDETTPEFMCCHCFPKTLRLVVTKFLTRCYWRIKGF